MNLNAKMMQLTVAGVLAAAAGCHSDKPHDYGRERPPVDQLDDRDKGLQSKDVVSASDQMAQSLLTDSALNGSRTQWVMVVDKVDNKSSMPRSDLDIFLRRVRVNLAKNGKGRVQLVENRAKLQELQSSELDGPRRDEYGQGDGSTPGRGGRLQPDYSLYARISELPNRGTSYYFMEFTVTDLHNGTQPWTDAYEVKVAR